MASAAASEVKKWLKLAHDGRDISALKTAFSILKSGSHGLPHDASHAGETAISGITTTSASAAATAFSSSLSIACCEDAIALQQWDIAAECVRLFQQEQKATKTMQARALYCEGLVRCNSMGTDLDRLEATDVRLACAGSILAGVSAAIEEWPKSAEAVVQGVSHLWSVISELYYGGHHRSILDVIAYVVTLHERLMIGGPYSHLQWTTRHATCLRAVGRLADAVAQYHVALETATRLRDERLQVQLLRALTVALSEREAVMAATGTKSPKGEALTSPRTAPGFAVHTTQLFLCGYYNTNGGISQARADLRSAFDRLEGVEALPSGPVAVGRWAAGGGSTSGGNGQRSGRQALAHAGQAAAAHSNLASSSSGGTGSSTQNVMDSEICSSDVLDELLSDVLLCLALAGSSTAEAPSEGRPQRIAAATARLASSANMRARTFALYAGAVSAPGCDAETLRRLSTAPDTSYLTPTARGALLTAVKAIESAMTGARAIGNASERDYATQMGCCLLWAMMQPLLLPPGQNHRTSASGIRSAYGPQQQQQLRQCLGRMADELQRTHAVLPTLQTAVEYQCSLLELELDNISQARRRAVSALRRLPVAGVGYTAFAPLPQQTISSRAQPPRSVGASPTASLSGGQGGSQNAVSALNNGLRTAPIDASPSAAEVDASLPTDFPLAWLRRRIDIRAAMDSSSLTTNADQALHAIEQAMTAQSQDKKVSFLKIAFGKLPPLLLSNPERDGSPTTGPPAGGDKSSSTHPTGRDRGPSRNSGSVNTRRETNNKKSGSSVMPAGVPGTGDSGAMPHGLAHSALPDRSLVYLHASLLRECTATLPVPEALAPIARAVAEALLSVPCTLSEGTRSAGPSEDVWRLVELASAQGEAALFLCEHAFENAREGSGQEKEASRRDSRTAANAQAVPTTISTAGDYAVKAAEMGWLLCENLEAGTFLCLEAVRAFLRGNKAFFERGDFGHGVSATLEKLYGFYHSLPVHATAEEDSLTVDLGVSLILSLLQEYMGTKPGHSGEVVASSYEEFLDEVLRYPKGDANSVVLKKALEVAVLTSQAVSDVSLKAHLCLLLPLLQRLNMVTGNGHAGGSYGGTAATGSSKGADPHADQRNAQEELLLLLGRLCNPALSHEERVSLVEQDAVPLLRNGPPTVQLCGRLGEVARALGLETVLLELCGIATDLYKSGKLGWWWRTRAGEVTDDEATGSPSNVPPARASLVLGVSSSRATTSLALGNGAKSAWQEDEVVKHPTPEDWYWYASLLQSQAALYAARCANVGTDSAVFLGLQVLTLCTNSATAAARAPVSARQHLSLATYHLFYDTLSMLWSKAECDRAMVVPSLRRMLSEHVLDPALVSLDASRKNKPTRRPQRSREGTAAREGFYELIFNLGVALLRCYMEGVKKTDGNNAGSGATAAAAVQEASAALSFLRNSLPSNYQRGLLTMEVGYVGSLHLPEELMARKLKGCDLDAESLAWCARARLTRSTRHEALAAWSRALAVSEPPLDATNSATTSTTVTDAPALSGDAERQRAFTRARTMLEMTEHLTNHGWLTYGEAVRTLHTSLSLLEHGSEDLAAPAALLHATQQHDRVDRLSSRGDRRSFARTLQGSLANKSLLLLQSLSQPSPEQWPTAHPAPGSASRGNHSENDAKPSSAAGNALRSVTEDVLTARELLLAVAMAATLWSIAPCHAHRPGEAKAAARADGLPWYTKRDYALLIVHYVECLWRLCGDKIEQLRRASPAQTTSDMETNQTPVTHAEQLPSSSVAWLGFTPSDDFVEAAVVHQVLYDDENTSAMHGTLLSIAQYMSQELGLEHHTFMLSAWSQFAATVRCGGARRSSANTWLTAFLRACRLVAYVAAVRCGAGSAAHVLDVGPAEPAHWRRLSEVLAPAPDAASSERGESLSRTAPHESLLPSVNSPHRAEMQASTSDALSSILLVEASCLGMLGRGEEADILVDLVQYSHCARYDADAVISCNLQKAHSLLTAFGEAGVPRALTIMRDVEFMEDSPLSLCSSTLRVKWLRGKCELLAAGNRWGDVRALLTGLTSASWASFDEPSVQEIDAAPVTKATAYLLAREAAECARRSVLSFATGLLTQTTSTAAESPAAALATECLSILGDRTGQFPPSLAAQLTAVWCSAEVLKREIHQYRSGLAEDASSQCSGTARVIGNYLQRLREEAERVERVAQEVVRLRAIEEGMLADLSGCPVGPSDGVVGRTFSVAATTEIVAQSTLTNAEGLLLLLKAENALERTVLGEHLHHLYRNLSLSELGLPKGDGPAHLERAVAAYMRDPTKAPDARGDVDAFPEPNLFTVSQHDGGEGAAAAAAWQQPTVELPAELTNAFAHFSLPVQLLEGASRHAVRTAVFAALSLLPASASTFRMEALLATVRVEYERSIECACGVSGRALLAASQDAIRHHVAQSWSQQPTVAVEKVNQAPGNRRRSAHGGASATERRLNAKRDAEALQSSQTQTSLAQLSEDQVALLSYASEVLSEARLRFSFRHIVDVLRMLSELLSLWGQYPLAAFAAEMTTGARLAMEALQLFSDTVGDTTEGQLWRRFLLAVGGGSTSRTEPWFPDRTSPVELRRLREELVSCSPMFAFFDSILCIEPLTTLTGAAERTAHANAPGANTSHGVAAPAGASRSAVAKTPAPSLTSVPFPVSDGGACLTVAQLNELPVRDSAISAVCDFLVVLHHPDGTTEGHMCSIPLASLQDVQKSLQEVMQDQRHRLLELRPTNDAEVRKTSPQRKSSATTLPQANSPREAFVESLAEVLARVDNEIVVPLFENFSDALALYGAKQPLHLCLDPVLQPFPVEHAPFLNSRVTAVVRELSAASLLQTSTTCAGSTGHRPLSRFSAATPAGGGASSASGGTYSTLFLLDPLGEHRASVDTITGVESGGTKSQRGPGGVHGAARVLTAGGPEMPVPEAAIAHALGTPSTSAVVMSACGSLGRVLPARLLASVPLCHVHSMLLAAGAVCATSGQREAREQLAQESGELQRATNNLPSVTTAFPNEEWVTPLLLLSRGVRCVSYLWYPLSPLDADTLCRRSLPGLLAGRGFADYAPAAVGVGNSRTSIASLSRSTTSNPKRFSVAVHYGTRVGAAAKTK